MLTPRHILPVIVFSQFAATSLWFAGNAILPQIERQWLLPDGALEAVTSAVQGGFIAGTLVFAFFSIADRFSPKGVFLVSALLGALANTAIVFVDGNYPALLLSRGLTGFFLAGLYPVGMRIAASWYQGGLGKALGFLVGALVLGTGFPHLLQGLSISLSWTLVTLSVSFLAVTGGVLLYLFVPDGPYLKSGAPFNPRALALIFASANFRGSAFGYFGHMWELYAFWAFLPVFLAFHLASGSSMAFDVSIWSFLIVAIGFFGCAAGGLLAVRRGSAPVAFFQLSVSAVCCLLSPLAVNLPTPLFLGFMLVWGLTVVGDSPQFSALNARTAPQELVGTALTIANCIGFTVTIFSIALVGLVLRTWSASVMFLVLLPGPLFGLWAMRILLRERC